MVQRKGLERLAHEVQLQLVRPNPQCCALWLLYHNKACLCASGFGWRCQRFWLDDVEGCNNHGFCYGLLPCTLLLRAHAGWESGPAYACLVGPWAFRGIVGCCVAQKQVNGPYSSGSTEGHQGHGGHAAADVRSKWGGARAVFLWGVFPGSGRDTSRQVMPLLWDA